MASSALGLRTFVMVATLLACGARVDGATARVTETAYRGTREVRYTTFASQRSRATDYDDFYRASARMRATRSGDDVVEEEMRQYVPVAGRGRADATAFVALTRYERASSAGEILLERIDTERTTFAYLHPKLGSHAFEGLDRRRSVEVRDSPELVWSPNALVYLRNDIARTVETSISHGGSGPLDGVISERVDTDGSVRESASDTLTFEKLEQTGQGRGSASRFSSGSAVSYSITPPILRRDGYVIYVVTHGIAKPSALMRQGENARSEADDWYPGGTILPLESDVVTTSGAEGVAIPERCGPGNATSRTHAVRERTSWTRIDGSNEVETVDTYGSAGRIVCRIEWSRLDAFDLETGRPQSRLETTTVLTRAP